MKNKTIQLREICHARSGDKTNKSNIGLLANTPAYYEVIKEQVTAARVKEHFSHYINGEVIRYEMPNINALNFIAYEALDGGGASSLRVDNLGKCFGAFLLRMEIEINESLL